MSVEKVFVHYELWLNVAVAIFFLTSYTLRLSLVSPNSSLSRSLIRVMERREMTRHKVHDGSTARFPSLRNRKLSKEYHVTNARGLQRSFSVNSAENDVLDFNRQKMRFTSFKRTLYNVRLIQRVF